ncbi:sigma intracellular receptor 2-like [Durio zibethinus]|uniref:Sigma intracellular receptor 2-like n=1 Tax=Durio zibethinus TaxID=66656 RepID=A0A6P6BF52_DURZI|nr:sigma intracellular receptor 2-like [Durio zibethinus]
MGGADLCKVVDSILLLMFVLISVAAPLVDSQTCLPETIYPDLLVRIYKWYAAEFQHFLLVEKPHFFVALVWLELVFQWPLALLNVYGMLASKPWFNTTCLIFGASFITSLAAIVGEILGSPKASDKLLKSYYPFMGFGVLALLRGLLLPESQPAKDSLTIGNGPALARKKRGLELRSSSIL